MKRQTQLIIQAGLAFLVLLLINVIGNSRLGGRPLYTAWDLTEEGKYTLTKGVQRLLEAQEDVIFVRVLLEGDFPAGFKRLQDATRDMLDDFRAHTPYLEYEFYNPNGGSVEEVNQRREKLSERGINPINLRVKGVDGTRTTAIYPYAIFRRGEREVVVNILENEVPGVPDDVILNNSVALLEFKFARAIQQLGRGYASPVIAFTEGHGELSALQTADLEKQLRSFYQVGRLFLDSVVAIPPEEIAALIIAKPRRPFNEKTKFKLDQYVMNGGKILWLLDRVAMDLDSLQQRAEYYPRPYELNLDDLLFRYGLRLNNDLVLDLNCTPIPLATGVVGNAPQFDLFPYPYHVLALPHSKHPIVKSLDAVNLFYPSSIDLSPKTKTPIEKTVLLRSSERTRYQKLPVGLDFRFLQMDLDASKFNHEPMTLAVLLEGTFASFYENRVTEDNLAVLQQVGIEFKPASVPNRMIVVADGDIAANPVRKDGSYLPLGYNPYSKYQFANKDFLVNALEYLLDEGGVIDARGKEVRLRLLNKERAQAEATRWQLLNIGLPLLLLGVFGLLYTMQRRRHYAMK
ncbi:MAG: gliding motility-associated ABC transporter substrate-binding protein GldG [Bacteroidetes bacterium]|nr:MAG: gliding motility-associated ABC transporter substrate-binding protein GldG [Bacteroidota bacterium]